jgi:hypothetical protein
MKKYFGHRTATALLVLVTGLGVGAGVITVAAQPAQAQTSLYWVHSHSRFWGQYWGHYDPSPVARYI